MYDTVKMLIESTTLPEVDFVTENTQNFNAIKEASDNQKLAAKFSVRKVGVQSYNGEYVIEFNHNVDRLMKEDNCSLTEAMEKVATYHDIALEDCVLVVDESVIDRIDLSDMNFQRFSVVRL